MILHLYIYVIVYMMILSLDSTMKGNVFIYNNN